MIIDTSKPTYWPAIAVSAFILFSIPPGIGLAAMAGGWFALAFSGVCTLLLLSAIVLLFIDTHRERGNWERRRKERESRFSPPF